MSCPAAWGVLWLEMNSMASLTIPLQELSQGIAGVKEDARQGSRQGQASINRKGGSKKA